MKIKSILIIIFIFTYSMIKASVVRGIFHNSKSKTIIISDPNRNLSLIIDYSKGCKVSELTIKDKSVLSSAGIYTGFRTKSNVLSTSSRPIKIQQNGNTIVLKDISYGDDSNGVTEIWTFKLAGSKVSWRIDRQYDKAIVLEETYFPKWNFKDLSTWKGGIIDNGGMVWCKYLPNVNDTYGVHTAGVTFWEPASGHAIRISSKTNAGLSLAAKFSHSESNEFTFTQMSTEKPLGQRYNLSRFVYGKADVYAPFQIENKNVSITLELEYVDYAKEYSRGTLPGIDAIAVRELLNTTGRYGVVDNNIIGANGWTTNWKCLHEPFFAQIGMALNDPNYTSNFSSTLDQERDLAMLPDGRVLSRWHNAAGDEIPGTYNAKTGYYEAMWGYTIDSQTGYVINASEQFDLNGDKKWLLSHKASCEKALDWLIKRDANGNGIFEMMNNGIAEQKASDWLDIVWASYENAFVNAQMYEALNLWAGCEEVLGDHKKADYYRTVAARLKSSFNKPIEEGGFWSEKKMQFVYWRDKDGSVHGDNLVTPVNFAVIAFGLCDDAARIATILDQIEKRNTQEQLFHWPLCYDSFKREEVSGGNWPFPKYENGDIFPTWGYLGVRAYVNHDKSISLKYIKNILEQYNKDGLSSQRYSRTTQKGLGDDILAGISTSITALYRDIYGVRPKWNRMGLEPNMSAELNGTRFSYKLRGIVYDLKINTSDFTISTDKFAIKSKGKLGVSYKQNQLVAYRDNLEHQVFSIGNASSKFINLEIVDWDQNACSWKVTGGQGRTFTFSGLAPNATYQFYSNGKVRNVTADGNGKLLLTGNNVNNALYRLERKI